MFWWKVTHLKVSWPIPNLLLQEWNHFGWEWQMWVVNSPKEDNFWSIAVIPVPKPLPPRIKYTGKCWAVPAVNRNWNFGVGTKTFKSCCFKILGNESNSKKFPRSFRGLPSRFLKSHPSQKTWLFSLPAEATVLNPLLLFDTSTHPSGDNHGASLARLHPVAL